MRATVSLWMSLCTAVLLIGCQSSAAAADIASEFKIEVELASSLSPLRAVIISADGTSISDMYSVAPTKKLTATIEAPNPAQWAFNSTLKITWGDGTAITLPIRLRSDRPQLIRFLLTYEHRDANQKSIYSLDDLNDDADGTLTQYLEAREIYNAIDSDENVVKVRALKMWFDAAYKLHQTTPYFGVDQKVILLAVKLEESARTSRDIALALKAAGINPNYFHEMRDQFISIAWREIGLVKKFQQQGRKDLAVMVNDYFLAQFDDLSDDDKKTVTSVQHFTVEQLRQNQIFLSAIAQATP